MVDAERFLALTERLREAYRRMDGSSLPDHRRSSWSRRMTGIAQTARENLEQAERQLERLEAEMQRHLGR